MNNISLICGILSIGVIYASQPGKPESDPALSCVLFDDLGCRIQCSATNNFLPLTDVSAYCETRKCYCKFDKASSLKNLWNRKFDSEDILEQIQNNRTLAGKVRRVLVNSSGTAEQTKQDLKAILPDEMFNKLHPKVNEIEFYKQNGDVERLKKFVDSKVKSMFHTSPEFDTTNLKSLNWVDNFLYYLDTNKYIPTPAIQSIYHQVGLTSNDVLKEYLDTYLKKNSDAPNIDTTKKYERDTDVSQIVTNFVIDGMINELGVPKSTAEDSSDLEDSSELED